MPDTVKPTQARTYVFEATAEEIDIVAQALSNLPWRVVNPIMVKFNQQMLEQMPKAAPAPAAKRDAASDESEGEIERPQRTARGVQDRPDPVERPGRRVNGDGRSRVEGSGGAGILDAEDAADALS